MPVARSILPACGVYSKMLVRYGTAKGIAVGLYFVNKSVQARLSASALMGGSASRSRLDAGGTGLTCDGQSSTFDCSSYSALSASVRAFHLFPQCFFAISVEV